MSLLFSDDDFYEDLWESILYAPVVLNQDIDMAATRPIRRRVVTRPARPRRAVHPVVITPNPPEAVAAAPQSPEEAFIALLDSLGVNRPEVRKFGQHEPIAPLSLVRNIRDNFGGERQTAIYHLLCWWISRTHEQRVREVTALGFREDEMLDLIRVACRIQDLPSSFRMNRHVGYDQMAMIRTMHVPANRGW